MRTIPSSLTLLLLAVAACSPRSGNRAETGRAEIGQADTGSADSAVGSTASATPAAPNDQMQAVLTALAALHPKPIVELSAPEARKQPRPADAVKAVLTKADKSSAPEPVGTVVNRTIPGPGGPIPVRIYTPKGRGPFPVVLYIHGGGWVIATLDTYDASPRALANLTQAGVVSTHYRQAPEHKFPAAHQDAFAAYKWTLTHAKALNGDPTRVAVAGESAGGNLAAAVSMMARDSGVQASVHQVLVYPIAGYDLTTPSYQENADAKPLNKPMMAWFFQQYLRSPADGKNPLIDLVHADLAGLPPATIVNARIDPLRSDGELLAAALKQAGVDVERDRSPAAGSGQGTGHSPFGR